MQLALIIARTLQFWAVATLFGGAGLALALHRQAAPAARTLRIAALAAATSGLVWFAIVFVTVTDGASFVDPDAWGAFLSAPFGWPWLVRLLLCSVAGAIALTRIPAAFLCVGAALAIDQAWLGHAATGRGAGEVLQIGVYWLHVLAGFAWVGALTMLCALTFAEGRIPADGLTLFSSAGTFVVAAIFASGVANAASRGLSFGALASTPYGRLLSVKLILFAAMLSFAAFNRFSRAILGRKSLLRVSLVAETGLGLAILGVVAILGITSPP